MCDGIAINKSEGKNVLNGALELDQKAYDEKFVINMLILRLFHNMLPSLIISDNLLTSLWGKP